MCRGARLAVIFITRKEFERSFDRTLSVWNTIVNAAFRPRIHRAFPFREFPHQKSFPVDAFLGAPCTSTSLCDPNH